MLAAMRQELALQKDYLQGQPIETIYIGGGTPSLLTAGELNKLFDAIFSLYPVNNLQECTMEANPDDLTIPYIKALRTTPVNRFSIGVQSFRDKDLRYMNRAHSAAQADYAIKAAQDAGFTNLSIDLIYGTPGLTDTDWLHNLQQVAQLRIPHFSAYALTVEEGTALYHAINKKKATPIDAEQSAAQFEILMDEATVMGYEHYEISNLARHGHYAIHNTNYWKGVPYIGIGPSAHSFDGTHRRWNIANNATYMQNLLRDNRIAYQEEQLSQTNRLNEYIMTSLRTMWGCSLNYIARQWDETSAGALKKVSEPMQEKGWLQIIDNKLILTTKGKLFTDHITSELFFQPE